MAEQIWKYPLTPGPQVFDVPDGASAVYVAVQGGQPCVWLRVDPARPVMRRGFNVVGTGQYLDGGEYIGSFMLHDGALVFHVLDHGQAP